MAKNPFIVLEALDAGGSQTQTNLLVEGLQKDGYNPLQLHFPQEDRATGQLIYEKFLLSRKKHSFSAREQALLYIQDFFARHEDLWQGIEGMSKHNVIVSDRFCTSTMAYQTLGKVGKKRIEILEWIRWLCYEGKPALPKPDLVLFIDTPVHISLERLQDKKKDFFETKEKLTAIRATYNRLAIEEHWTVISGVDTTGAQRTRPDIHGEIWEHVHQIL